jgi:hypothetical protein
MSGSIGRLQLPIGGMKPHVGRHLFVRVHLDSVHDTWSVSSHCASRIHVSDEKCYLQCTQKLLATLEDDELGARLSAMASTMRMEVTTAQQHTASFWMGAP